MRVDSCPRSLEHIEQNLHRGRFSQLKFLGMDSHYNFDWCLSKRKVLDINKSLKDPSTYLNMIQFASGIEQLDLIH